MWDDKSGTNISVTEGEAVEQKSAATIAKIEVNCDSGFISGQQAEFPSEEIECSSPQEIDSGAVKSDIITTSSSLAEDPVEGIEMKLDSPVSCSLLPEWFCSMKIDGPLNNLSSKTELSNTKKNSSDQATYTMFEKKRPLWEICYIQDDDGDTHLHLAIIAEYVPAVFAIIRLAPVPAALDIRNDDAQTPLHLAVFTRQANIVRRLIVAGAKATIRDGNGNTPLHLACLNGDKACVEALTTPITSEELKEAYKHNKERKLPHHVKPHRLPVDLEQRNYDGEQCVHICAQRNDIDILRHLVKLGADINAREGKAGYTALHFACDNGNQTLVQFLLNECSKLNVETCTYGLWTAYQLASVQKSKDLMFELKRYGAQLLSPPTSDDEANSTDSYDEEDLMKSNCKKYANSKLDKIENEMSTVYF